MKTARPDVEHFFKTREEASLAAAKCIATALTRRLDCLANTSLVVTGGSSPLACYKALAGTELTWDRVNVLLSDERWIPPTHDDSNERMVRSSLLTQYASAAIFHPLYVDGANVAERCESFTDELRRLPIPFACSILGMGEDGHIASLFPDADNFEEGIDADGKSLCVPIKTAASPHRRISLTLAVLLQSDEIVLLFFGDTKHTVYEQAKLAATANPVSKLLHQDRAPVHAFWAP